MNTYLKLDTAMKSIITCGLLLLSMLLMSNSCDKNVDEIKEKATNETTDPLKIDLQGVEKLMVNPHYSSLTKMSLIDQFFMPYRFFFNNFINHESLWSY